MNSSTLNSTQGFIITGANRDDHLADPVSSAGDINGDGAADFIVSAQGHAVYVIFGSSNIINSVSNSDNYIFFLYVLGGGATILLLIKSWKGFPKCVGRIRILTSRPPLREPIIYSSAIGSTDKSHSEQQNL